MSSSASGTVPSFAAWRHSAFRIYLLGNALAMMADSAEHAITYWIAFQLFESPTLGGFAMLSHWLPFLLFSIPMGTLADRLDPRRLVQIGMGLFMFCSLAWAFLFLTGTLQMWHAAVLLVVHGCAGVFWAAPSQVLIHDIVGPAELPSAVRLLATCRYLGLLVGPSAGSLLLLIFGPVYGLSVNALIYLPLLIWLIGAPFGPRFRAGAAALAPRLRGFADVAATFRAISGERTIVSMILLSGCASMIIANGYQPQMPEFGRDLGHGDPGAAYSALLAADAAGAAAAGLLLEARGLVPKPRTAFLFALLWCCVIGGFALAESYPLALLLLFVAGFTELSFNSMAQSLVQLQAPAEIRGRVIGVYNMAAMGLRAFSGVTIGILGGFIGIHVSLALSALVLLAVLSIVFGLMLPRRAAA